MKKITVYATVSCPYCHSLKQWFRAKGIKFDEYNVDLNPIAARQMILLSGRTTVPFTTIEEGDKIDKIYGYDLSKLNSLFI